MTITWLENDVVYNDGNNPTFKRCIGYEETGRNSTSVTLKIHLKLKVQGYGTSTSFYGFGINWRVDGGGWLKIKDSSPRWYGNEGYRSFSTTITKSVSASGGGVGFSVQIDGLGGACDYTKSYTANASTWNTAPYWSSGARLRVKENDANGYLCAEAIDGTENSVKVREDVSKYYVYWDYATDNDNNVKHYDLYCQINDGTWNKIYTGATRNYTHNVGGGSSTQGQKIDYYVIAVDSYNLSSPSLNTTQFQKNSLNPATISIGTAFYFDTTATTLTWRGASNTNGNGTFTYRVHSPQITIYNKEKLTASGGQIKCLKSGTSTDPYILFEDLKKLVASSNTKEGYFDVVLTTRNAYGSEATNSSRCHIDLRTDPNPPSTISIGGKTSTSLGAYLIPTKAKPTVSWSGASDKLGGSLTYNVYYKIGSGSESLLSTGTNTSVTLPISSVSASATLGVRVEAVTSYGRKKSASNNAETLHYYNPPSVSIGNMNRTISTVKVDISNKINTSIPNVKFNKQSFTGNGTSGNYTGNLYTATISGLTNASTFDLVATVNDNSGLSADVKATIKVVPATPKFSVREKGVGINCINETSQSLAVEGGANIKGGLIVDGKNILQELTKGLYPIGSIYMSTISTNPSSYFGGTWVAWGSGRVPVGINTGDGDFNAVEKTGGNKSNSASHTHGTNNHTLTISQIPAHNHSASTNSTGGHTHNVQTQKAKWASNSTTNTYCQIDATSGYVAMNNPTTTNSGNHSHSVSIGNNGGGGGHNHGNTGSSSVSLSTLQPYITCYMWKRTA